MYVYIWWTYEHDEKLVHAIKQNIDFVSFGTLLFLQSGFINVGDINIYKTFLPKRYFCKLRSPVDVTKDHIGAYFYQDLNGKPSEISFCIM